MAMAAVSAEAAKSRFGPFALNAQAPDEGNMHTLLHWGTEEQNEKYLRGLCRGTMRSCFAMTEPDVGGNSAFIVDIPSEGWEIVRDVQTMIGAHNHCEIRITDFRVKDSQMLGGPGQGHMLGQARLGPARLAHCMRWLGQSEIALDMMIDRATKRFSHGSLLSEKQGIQWMISDSTMEIYQSKLMILHAAYKIDRRLHAVGARAGFRARSRNPFVQ